MASGQQGAVLWEIHRLFDAGTVAGLGEEELLGRFVARRDEAAFAALVARHGPIVLGVCRRWLRDPRDVEDAFQATFLILIRRAASIKNPRLLGPWLHGVAYRVARQARVLAVRRSQRERSGGEMEANAVETAGLTRRAEELDVLRTALDEEIQRLPDSLRLPVVLCHLEGLTQPEAARRLRTTPDTVRGRLARAREKLRSRLTRRGFALPGGLLAVDLGVETASAALPTPLFEATIRMLTAGTAPTASVATLAEGVLRAMTLTRLKAIVCVLLAAGTVAAVAARSDDLGAEEQGEAFDRSIAKPQADTAAPNTPPRSITVEARDLVTDAPVPDVHLELRAGGPRVEVTTDASGTARLSLPDTAEIRFFSILASRDGLVPLAINWRHNASSPGPPDHFLFQVERATTISGRVLDQDQQPVADATVVIRVRKHYPKSEQMVDVSFESTKTDADGRWSFSNVPEQPDSVELGTYHHLYLTDRSFYLMEKFTPISVLRDGSAVLRLRRGTRIEGTVLGPGGQPVSDAEVFNGECGRAGNSIPPVRTDSQGKFTLGIEPGVSSNLIAVRAGFGPALQPIRVGTEPQPVTLTLQPSHTLSGRVIERGGKPIAGARLFVTQWRGRETLSQELTSDSDGRFLWKDAPSDELRAEINAGGYVGKRDVSLTPGAPNEIVLSTPTTVKGTVLDADTGRPISEFSLAVGTVWNPGERLIWQGRDFAEDKLRKASGSFECTFDMEAHRYLVRVQAEGYLPEDAEPFAPDGSPRAFTFRLTRAAPIRGTVVNPDGSPAQDGVVCLSYASNEIQLSNGDLPEGDRRRTVHAKIAPDGRFTLPPQKDTFLLVALSDAGFAVVRGRGLAGDDTLRLQPWARVSGTVKLDGKPAVDLELSADPDPPLPVVGEPRLNHQFRFKTDANGRFELPRLMPGHHEIGRWVPNGVPGRIWFITLATLDAEPGQVYDLKIGESGHRVTGRLVLPTADVWMIRKAAIEPRAAKDRGRSIGVQIDEAGRFRAGDLQAGDYTLRVSIHEPPPDAACGWGRLIGDYSREFTVAGGDADDDPLDLGALEPAEVGGRPLQIGDVAPDFTVKTLDGKDLTLADFQGKFLLLDFWATWCAPCVAELPNLKAVHEAYRNDHEFAIVSLSLDEEADILARFVKDHELPWLQGIVGPESPVVTAYGATAIPATFLIGPDGRIIASDLRGSQAKEAVAKALGR